MLNRDTLLLTAFALMAPTGVFGEVIVADSFNDNSLNTSVWSVFALGGPGSFSVSEVNQRLEITAALAPNATADLFVGVNLLGSVVGDFDAQVSYELLSDLDADALAADESAGVGLVWAWYPTRFVIRCSWHRPCYGTDLLGGPDFDHDTTDIAGRVRVTREGPVLTAYYWTNSDWQLLLSATDPNTSPVNIWVLAALPVAASVAFDDFYLRADDLTGIPEPASALLAAGGLIALCALRRRRCAPR